MATKYLTYGIHRGTDGASVEVLPGGSWFRITLPDGRTEQVLLSHGESGGASVSFGTLDPDHARPFAEALVAVMGGRIVVDSWSQRVQGVSSLQRVLLVVLGGGELPPISLDELDPHDGDE